MDLHESIRLQALLEVEKGDSYEYLIRYIYRSVSREYHIPLEKLEEDYLIEEVLRIFWETAYEGMSAENRWTEIQKLSKSEQEHIEQEVKEELEDEIYLRKMREAAKIKVPKVEKAGQPPPNLVRFLKDAIDPIKPPTNKPPIPIKR